MSSTQKHYLKINPYLDIISGITVVLSFSDGIIKIIGREGSGKSVLTQLLAAELVEEEQEVVIFSDIPHSESDLHDPIQQQLHLDLGENSDFYAALNHHIQARPFDQQKLILVFDDADQIPDDCFDAIRTLFEKNYHDRPEVSMVFAGTDLLDQKLNEPQNRTFNKNIILNFEVKPMNRGELEAFCNAYLEEMGLQSHHLSKDDLDSIFNQTQGLPGKIPELIFAILDREEEEKKAEKVELEEDKGIIGKLVELDDDPEPELAGLSVEDREEVLTAFKDQVPWRWQSNGVGIAVVVLFIVVAYGYFVPESERTDSIVIFPPPGNFPGALSSEEVASLAETLVEQSLEADIVESAPQAEETPLAPEDLLAGIEEEIATEEELIEQPAIEEVDEPILAETTTEPVIEETQDAIDAEETEVVAEAEPDAEPETESENIAETELIAEAEVEEPAAEPDTTPAETPQTGVLTFVTNWLGAWESQDVNDYFQAYHSEFIPEDATSQTEWQSDRTARINRPASIDIALEDFEIVDENDFQTSVQVQFTYASPNYADRTTKELALVVENGEWAIIEELNLAVERLSTSGSTSVASTVETDLDPVELMPGESGFEAKIRQVLELASMAENSLMSTPYGSFINDWLGAWKSQDVEGYFRHYHDNFEPAYFDSMNDWRADRIRKINEKRFIDIAFNDIEVLDETNGDTRIRFWLSYVSSFYLDRTLKEVIISGSGSDSDNNDLAILEERNLEIEIIPFYP